MSETQKTGIGHHVENFFGSFIDLWNSHEVLKFSNIRVGYLQYFFALPLALTFVNTQNTLVMGSLRVFGLSASALTFMAFAFGAAVMFIIRAAGNMHIVSKISSILTLIGFAPWLFLPQDGSPAFVCSVVFMIGAGCCMANSSSFMMVLNNAERFFGCALMTLLISLIRINSAFIREHTPLRLIIVTVLVIGISICMYKTKKEDFSDFNRGKYDNFNPSIWLSLFILLSFYVIRIMGFNIPEFNMQYSTPLISILAIVPPLLCVIIQLAFNRTVWIMCNVFFISAILSYVMVFTGNTNAAYVFSGIKEIGLLVGFYLCACVVNRFCDFHRHKVMEFVCISVLGAVYIASDLLLKSTLILPVSVTVAATLFVIFLLLSPAFSAYLFSAEWSEQFVKLNMSEIKAQVELAISQAQSDKTDISEEEKAKILTKGEIDFARMWCDGKTRSEITRSLHLTAAEADKCMSAIREKILKDGDPDPFIAAAIAKYNLTPRETDMLRCLQRDMTNAEIAAELFLSEETVKTHVRNMLKKLKITNRNGIILLKESFNKTDV
jgi:DNA-binding CsgD family transcriptional regulator